MKFQVQFSDKILKKKKLKTQFKDFKSDFKGFEVFVKINFQMYYKTD